jgi:glucan phosphoethanolaminetransferase (alkaline phosphatase superfamily)
MPILYQYKNRVINYGLISSGANSSIWGNRLLQYGPNPERLSQTFYSNTLIWQYAQKAGYKVICIFRNWTHDNSINMKDSQFIEYIGVEGNTSLEVDTNIALTIKKLINNQSKTPLFIYAVKAGIHFPYEGKVPDNNKIIKTSYKGSIPATRQDLINSYKNCLNYITDPFFGKMLNGLSLQNTVIFYTSDHGQNLLDNGHLISHGSTTNVSYYEGLVPLLIFSENNYYLEKFKIGVQKNKNKASHFNIFPTLLDIWGYKKNEYAPFHGVSLFDDIKFPRKFLITMSSANRIKHGNYKWVTIPDFVVAN